MGGIMPLEAGVGFAQTALKSAGRRMVAKRVERMLYSMVERSEEGMFGE